MSDSPITIPYGQSEITIDFNTGAFQADGSVLVSRGGTTVLVTASFDREPLEEVSFVPLRVDYVERFYAIHQIIGPRYTRREGKPSDEAVLTARMIDRSIRPHLPVNLQHSLHVVATVLSLGTVDPDTLSIIGASVAITQTGLDWSGPVAAAKVEICTEHDLHVNEMANRKIGALTVAGTTNHANMIEFDGPELTEELVSRAFVTAIEANNAVAEHITSITTPETNDKVAAINKMLTEGPATNLTDEGQAYQAKLATGWRADGRGAKEIRPVSAVIAPLSGTHGSARFSRGSTTALATVTLGTLRDGLLNESIETVQAGTTDTRFIVHYNFPPYATGGAGGIGSPNRREVGHGYLARKALQNLLPGKADYPYSIRLVSEILSSDGSSSMASVCAGSLALLSSGTPIDSLAAGLSIGLAGNNDDYVMLSDICGDEDHYGLMDFKIAGTKQGITAMQLDTKNAGISVKIFNEALSAGKAGRGEIIDQLIAEKGDMVFGHPESAPLIVEVPKEHIGRIIGKGGSNIRTIEESSGAQVSIENDRFAVIEGTSDAKKMVLEQIQAETREYHIDEDFQATVREFLPYGAIVELDAGREALLHVSELRDEYVEKTEDLLKIGDVVPVTIVETSSDGRIKVSVREKHPKYFGDQSEKPAK